MRKEICVRESIQSPNSANSVNSCSRAIVAVVKDRI